MTGWRPVTTSPSEALDARTPGPGRALGCRDRVAGHRPAISDLRAGDLVFFASSKTNPATIYHVGLYIGGGQMIEAPFTGENVRISSIYRASLFGAGRP